MTSSRQLFNVVITAPHAACSEKDVPCDKAAGPVAESLRSSLENEGVSVGGVFVNRAFPRTQELDMNRRPSRTHSYRQQITRHVSKLAAGSLYLLDVHSFPHPAFEGSEFAVLSGSPGRPISGPAQRLVARVREKIPNLRVVLLHGAENDIMIQMLDLGHTAVLLEYDERIRTPVNAPLLAALNREIALWLKAETALSV